MYCTHNIWYGGGDDGDLNNDGNGSDENCDDGDGGDVFPVFHR